MIPSSKLHHCTPSCLVSVTLMIVLTFSPLCCTSYDTISATQTLTVNQTLISSNGIYELGFFKPNKRNKWYVGIWYHNLHDQVIVWVANGDHAVNDPYGVLQIVDSKIVILSSNQRPKWSSNNSRVAINPVAQILETGNFVLREAEDWKPENFLWQSFDVPTDTMLPGMKLGCDLTTGMSRNLQSWKSPDDPSSGDYVIKMNPYGNPEFYLWQGTQIVYRSGPWTGSKFSGLPEMKLPDSMYSEFVMGPNEIYYRWELRDTRTLSRLVLNPTGFLVRLTWLESHQVWNPLWHANDDRCDQFRRCGTWGVCTDEFPACKCLPGFQPKNPNAWDLRYWSDGCKRSSKLESDSDGFLAIENIKLPLSPTALVNPTMSLTECEAACRKNCSCTAFANRFSTDLGSGCVMWTGELEDMRQFSMGGQTLYIRLAADDLASYTGNRYSNIVKPIAMILGLVVGTGILFFCSCFVWQKAKEMASKIVSGQQADSRDGDHLALRSNGSSKGEFLNERQDDLGLPLYEFSVIESCTGFFSDANKLGQGGFGCVYKGTLPDRQEVAVKRLSKNSGQGTDEFKNEVKLAAKLQHRNLVRLVGCSIEIDEKVLIYEYMPNGSLDSILFSSAKRCLKLDWCQRFNIICGIARGLLYLHQDSRFKVIHRDLKASNILLDGDFTPKIFDFGMARIFGLDQTKANTRIIVGTYGYMAPEYAMHGLFSVMSDVYSFGVLVLEIISGKRNRGFYYEDDAVNLLSRAWNAWGEHRGVEVVYTSMGDNYPISEVLRCIQIGLLCVQECAEDRPTMSSVVLMLSSDTVAMPEPKQPGFPLGKNSIKLELCSSSQ